MRAIVVVAVFAILGMTDPAAAATRSSQSSIASARELPTSTPKFLSVWTSDTDGNKDVYGRITVVGGTTGPAFLIAGGAGNQHFPQAAKGTGGDGFFVVFQDDATGQIKRVGVSSDGAVLGSTEIASIGTDSSPPQHPTIACGGTLSSFGPSLCVIGYAVYPVGYAGGIEWVAIAGDTVHGRNRMTKSRSSGFDLGYDFPTVALAGSLGNLRGAAAYLDPGYRNLEPNGYSKLYRINFDLTCSGQFTTTCTFNGFSLTLIDSAVNLYGPGGPPRLVAGNTGYLMAWTEADLWKSGVVAARLNSSAVVIDSRQLTNGVDDAACTGESLGMAPSVAFSSEGGSYQYVVAWNQYTMPWDRAVMTTLIDEGSGLESGRRSVAHVGIDGKDMLTPPGVAASAYHIFVAQHYNGLDRMRGWFAQDGFALTSYVDLATN